jgi:hypothetical protein
MFVRDCIRCYTSDYSVVEYKYRAYSGSSCGRERLAERLERLQNGPKHYYEIDADPLIVSTEELTSQQVGTIIKVIFACFFGLFRLLYRSNLSLYLIWLHNNRLNFLIVLSIDVYA